MDRALPSKKIFFLIVACITGVGTIGFAVYASKSNNTTKSNPTISVENLKSIDAVTASVKENSKLDQDQDGLANWEESLWGTDPNKTDTDGDKTNDGDEVRAGRNPAVAGPKDTQQNGQPGTKAGAIKEVTSDKTETGQISRVLFASYLEAKKGGVPIDDSIQNKIIAEAFSDKSLDLETKQYALKDIKVSKDSDLKKYGNALGVAFYTGRTKNTTSEISILNTAVTQSPKDIEKLDPIITGYAAILKSLAVISAPKELVSLHLELLNNTSKVLGDIRAFRKIFDDPFLTLKAISNYYTDVASFQSTIAEIRTTFEKEGIQFSNTEYGYVFVHTI